MRPGRANILPLAFVLLTVSAAHSPAVFADTHVHPVLLGKVRLPSAGAPVGVEIQRRPKYRSLLTVANVSESHADVTVTYYKSGKPAGNAPATAAAESSPSAVQNLSPGEVHIFDPADRMRGKFLGIAVVESDEQLLVVSQTSWRSGGKTYVGVHSGSQGTEPASSLLLGPFSPGGTNLVCIQNAGSQNTTAFIRYNDAGGSFAGEQSTTVPGGGAICQALGPWLEGSAVVVAGSGAQLIGTTIHVDQRSFATLFPWASAGTRGPADPVFVPLVRSDQPGIQTGINVQNISTKATDVTITYRQSGETAPTAVETRNFIRPFGSATFTGAGLPDPFVGSATIQSSRNDDIIAVVNQVESGDTISSYNGFSGEQSTGRGESAAILVPKALNPDTITATHLQIQNVGAGKAKVLVTCSDGKSRFRQRAKIDKRSNSTVEMPAGRFTGAAICTVGVLRGRVAAVAHDPDNQIYLPIILK